MNVRELMNLLSKFPEDMDVAFLNRTGDYWGTELGRPVNIAHRAYVKHDPYHNANRVINPSEDEEGANEVLLLSW